MYRRSCPYRGSEVLVGYLGESRQLKWWPSSFLDDRSEPFLAPIFGKAASVARVVGVTEVARRVHDDAIGVGRSFHLFRLPESMEQELHRTLIGTTGIAAIELVDSAKTELDSIASREAVPRPGPVHVGALNMLANEEWIPVVASHYSAAFGSGIQSFPFFSD